MAAVAHQHMRSENIELYLKDTAVFLSDSGSSVTAALNSGRSLKADMMIVLEAGVKPETRLAAEAGL